MSDIAIHVDKLSKRYKIGARQESYRTLRDTIASAFTVPFRQRRQEEKKRSYIWALKDISFEVKRGEVVGIIGSNGAGKTTLLKIFSRITEPTEGCAEVWGRVGSLLEVGTGFHPELTGRENIYLSGAILGMKKVEIDRSFDDIVAFSEIEKFLDTPVKRYSSGMYVRLAFGVAAHLEPEILLVDEVLAVGDVAFQKKCLGKMGDVAKAGRTVLLVSHNMAAINALAGRCLLLKDAHLEMSGDPAIVTVRYLSDNLFGSQGGLIDLSRRTRLDFSMSSHASPGFIKLMELTMTDYQGKPSNQFYAGDPINISVSFEVRQAIDQFEIGLAISAMGVRIFLVKTGKRIWHASPGRYRISTAIGPNYLTEGIYSLTLGIHSSTWQDGGSDIASFEIISNPNRPQLHPMFSGAPGLVDLGYSWGAPSKEDDFISELPKTEM